MGDNQTTTTNTSGPSDPMVKSTLDQLLGTGSSGLQGILAGGPTYTGPGSTTTSSWQQALAAAGNPAYASGVSGALTDQAAKASGQDIGVNDPTYQALRTQDANDALSTVNGVFNNSGRFGGGSNAMAAGTGVENALDNLDYTQMQNGQQQQQQAITNLPNLFTALQAPSATAGAVGSAQDAATQAGANQNLTFSQQLSQILGGLTPSAGTTSTSTAPATPWYQALLGAGISAIPGVAQLKTAFSPAASTTMPAIY